MAIRQSDAVEVKRVKGKGRGVFARRAIRKGEVFETCPVLVVPAGAIEDYSTGFGPYVFEWGEGKVALALGFGSLYNHSYRPNARYNDVGPQTKAFKALWDIAREDHRGIQEGVDPRQATEVMVARTADDEGEGDDQRRKAEAAAQTGQELEVVGGEARSSFRTSHAILVGCSGRSSLISAAHGRSPPASRPTAGACPGGRPRS